MKIGRLNRASFAKTARRAMFLFAFAVLGTQAATVATVDGTGYETLEAAIAAAEPVDGVVTYEICGKAEVSATGWIQVLKSGLSNVKKVAFVGRTEDAEICIAGDLAILADQRYDIDVSFKNLKLSKLNPKYGGDYGHSTNYFTTWLRNTGAAENTVTYENCTFPNGACNNQYGKTVYKNCTFANGTTGLYNLWIYGGSVEMNGGEFTGTRGMKVYTEGTPATAPSVEVKGTAFSGLTEKAAIVVSKAATVEFAEISVADCPKGLFQKDIEGSSDDQKVTVTANGSKISGSFEITANREPETAKTEFNITGGMFTAEVPSDYCADGFTVKATTDADGNTVYGVVEKTELVNYVTLELVFGDNVADEDVVAAKALYAQEKYETCKAANEAYMALFGVTWGKGYLDVTDNTAPLYKYAGRSGSVSEVRFYIHGTLAGFTSLQSSGNQIDCTVGGNHQISRTSYSIIGVDGADGKAKLTDGNVQAYVAGGYASMFTASGKLTIDNIEFTSTTSTTVGASATRATESDTENEVASAEMEIKNCTFRGRLYVYDNFENQGKMTYSIHNCVFDGSNYSGDSNAYAIFAQCKGGNNLVIKDNAIAGFARGINIDHANVHATIEGNKISVTDTGRSCIQLSSLATADIVGNTLELTGGNAITLHEKLLTLGVVPEVSISGNTVTGTGYLIYDDAKANDKAFTSDNLKLTYATDNTVAETVDTTKGVKGSTAYITSTAVNNEVQHYVAQVGTTGYTTLAAAIAALSAENHTLTLLNENAWDATTPVYWAAGAQSGYAATLTAALTAAYKADAGAITVVCRPGADVGEMTHGHVADDLTIYGNDAYLSGGECDLEVDTYTFSRATGKQATDGVCLDKDITITAYELDNLGVWGQRHTAHKVTVNLTDCDGKALEGKTNLQRVYISGTTGVNDITLTDCDFLTKATAVYSNADGAIKAVNCSFTDGQVPFNINHKANGTQTVALTGCRFTNCGDAGGWKQFAAPLRLVNSGAGTQSAVVTGCAFAGTVGANGDILLGDGRTGQASNDVELKVVNTVANIQAQKPGYYGVETVDATKKATAVSPADGTLETSVAKLLPVNDGSEAHPYSREQFAAMTRAEYIAAQERLGGTLYVNVGDYVYGTDGVLGNGVRDDTTGQVPDHSELNAYGENGYLGEKNDGANGHAVVFVGGTITSGVTGYTSIDSIGTSLLLAVPAYTKVTFKETAFKNVLSFNYQLYTSPWSQLGGLTFNGCTFDGIIVGAIAAQELAFNGCTFNNYVNTTDANSSNPTWIRPAYGNWTKGDNEGQGTGFRSLTKITFENNKVTSTRPVKFERIAQWEMATTVTATNNTFAITPQEGDTSTKNVGLYFGANAKFDLVIDKNEKSGETAALYTAVYSAPTGVTYAGLPAGSTVKNAAGEAVSSEDALAWKTNDKITLKTTEEVASVTNAEGVSVNFATLADAIAAAQAGETVTLLTDVESVSVTTVVAGKDIVLDLNGKTLTSTANNGITIEATAKLTVKDSLTGGKVVATGEYSNAIENKGTLVIESGSFEAVYGAIRAVGGSTTTISGGTFASSTGRYGMYYWANGTALSVTVNGGLFKNSVSTAMDNGKVALAVYSGSFANDLSLYCPSRDGVRYGTVLDETSGLYVYAEKGPDGYVEDESGNVTLRDAEALRLFALKVNNGNNFKGKTVTLANDIDLANTDWTPIGRQGSGMSFNGVFDGVGHTVTGLKVSVFGQSGVGFFGETFTATIRNLTVVGAITGNRCNYIGGIVGHGYATIDNCTFRGTIVGSRSYQVGGIAGSGGFTITRCTVEADVSGESWVGGLIANAQDGGVFTDCYVKGTISADTVYYGVGAAGIAAIPLYATQKIAGCYSDTVVKNAGVEVNAPIIGAYNDAGITVDTQLSAYVYGNSWNKQKNTNDSYPVRDSDKEIEGKVIPRDSTLIMLEDDLNYVTGNLNDIHIMAGSPVTPDQVAALAVAQVGDAKYATLASAIAAATDGDTITLLADVTVAEQLVVEKPLTLDLGGKAVTSTYAIPANGASGADRYALLTKATVTVKNGTFVAGQARALGAYANLTLTDAAVTSELTGGHCCVAFCAAGGTYTVANATIKGDYAIANFAHNATIAITGSALEGSGCGLYHNGSYYGLKLTVSDTTINGAIDQAIGEDKDPSGVYLSGSLDVLANAENQNGAKGRHQATFTRCTIKGNTGVEVKYTDLTLEDCTVVATTKEPSYTQNNNGMAALGFAVVSTDNATGNATPKPEGTITITGADGSYTGLVGLGSLDSVKTGFADFEDAHYAVSGGTFSTAVLPEYCAAGFIPTENGDGTYGVKVGAYVAAIGTTGYETLEAALAAAQAGETVKMLADVTLTAKQTIAKALVLDLNGKTISSTAYRTISLGSGANVTIQDSSAEKTGKVANGYKGSADPYTICLDGYDAAALTLVSGTVEANPHKTDLQSVAINTNHEKDGPYAINIRGGKVFVPESSTNGRAIVAGENVTLTVEGGEIVGGLHGVDVYGGSTTVITGGSISARVVDTGVIEAAYGLRATGTASVTIGAADGTADVVSVAGIKMDDDGYKLDVPTVTVNSGTIAGPVYSITKGTIVFNVQATSEDVLRFADDTAAKFLPSNLELRAKDIDGKTMYYVAAKPVAAIGAIGYETLEAALAAAKDGETVKLLADVTESVTIAADRTLTLDLNGKTLSAGKASEALTVTGYLTIDDTSATKSGRVVGDGQYAVYMNNRTAHVGESVVGGSLTLNAGSLEGATYGVYIRANQATLTMNGGKVSATKEAIRTANDCHVKAISLLGGEVGDVFLGSDSNTELTTLTVGKADQTDPAAVKVGKIGLQFNTGLFKLELYNGLVGELPEIGSCTATYTALGMLVKSDANCPSGKVFEAIAYNGETWYRIAALQKIAITFDGSKTVALPFATDWLKAHVGKGEASWTTAALEGKAENGLAKWQCYLFGLDPSKEDAKVVATAGQGTDEAIPLAVANADASASPLVTGGYVTVAYVLMGSNDRTVWTQVATSNKRDGLAIPLTGTTYKFYRVDVTVTSAEGN